MAVARILREFRWGSAINVGKSGKVDDTVIFVKANRGFPETRPYILKRRSFVQTARAGMETAIRLSQLVLIFSKVNIYIIKDTISRPVIITFRYMK